MQPTTYVRTGCWPQIRAVHTPSRGTYGIMRVRAELTLGLGISLGHNQVELLMDSAVLDKATQIQSHLLKIQEHLEAQDDKILAILNRVSVEP